MHSLESLLSEGAVKHDFYWGKRSYKNSAKVWDDLAERNYIHAAISAGDEEGERRKSVEAVETLKRHLTDGVILDLGCGYGRIAKYLLPDRKFAGYVGVDGSVRMLEIFFNRYAKNGQEQRTPLLLVNADIDDTLLKESVIDNVVTSAVFLHNHKSIVRKSVDEIFRVMKPGAKLFILSSFPNIYNLNGLSGVLYLWGLKLAGREFKNGPVRYFSKSEVGNLFGKFKKVEIHPVGFSMMPKSVTILPESLRLLYRKALYEPLERLAKLATPARLHKTFCAYYDVVAYK